MSISLSKRINTLSEIYSKKSKDKTCKPECQFKGLNKLSYNCHSFLSPLKLEGGEFWFLKLRQRGGHEINRQVN